MVERTKRPYRRAAETREHILDVASRLFYADGIHAVGIDRIAAEAQVTTTTLYRLFGSKDGLVVAYVRRADEEWFAKLDGKLEEGGIEEFFDDLDDWARRDENRGCMFTMAITEYPDAGCEVHCIALENKQRTRERFREYLIASGNTEPDLTADKLLLIMNGIEASAAGRSRDSGPGPGPALVRDLLRMTAPSTAAGQR